MLVVLKKKSIEREHNLTPEKSLKELYDDSLFRYCYPEDFDFPEGEEGKVFDDFNKADELLVKCLKDTIEITEDVYEKLKIWISEKLEKITLKDLAVNGTESFWVWEPYCKLYEALQKPVDFNTEVVLWDRD